MSPELIVIIVRGIALTAVEALIWLASRTMS